MTVTRFDLGLEFSGGFPAPTAEECAASALCRATLDAVGEPSLEYVAATDAVTADGTLSAALAPFLRGLGLTVDATNRLRRRIRPRLWQFEERFPGGLLTPGAIGSHGWALTGSATPVLTRSASSPGVIKLRLATDVNLNDVAAAHLGATASQGVCVPSLAVLRLAQFVVNLPALTTRRVFFGWCSDFANLDTPSSALGVLYDSSSSPNWQVWARAGGVGAPVASAEAAVNGDVILSIVQVGSVFQFYADDTLLGSASSNIPSAALNFGWGVKTLAGSSANADCAFASFEAELNAAWDDDTFLET